MTIGRCQLGDLAMVALGYKSLQNRFFYLSPATIKTYGIEKEFLRPIYRMKDLNSSRFDQTGKPGARVFVCKHDEADIRGTGALKYIRAMENLPATAKKQAGKPQTIRDALKAQGGGNWYGPKAKLHGSHIWLRKAFSSVYAPYIFSTTAVLDQRCNLIRPRGDIPWEAVAAVLTSSLFALAAESFGSASLGAGALELATKRLRQVPVPDIRRLTAADIDTLMKLASSVWDAEQPVDWSTGEPGSRLRKLDSFLLGQVTSSVVIDRLYEDVRETCLARLRLAQDKDVAVKKVVQRDIAAVGKAIADGIVPLLDGKQFPEAFFPPDTALTLMELPRGPLSITIEPLLSEATVTIRDITSNKVAFAQNFPRYPAQVLVRALLMGRRVFNTSTDSESAGYATDRFLAWFPSVLEKIDQQCRSSALGTRFEEQLHADVLGRLKLHPQVHAKELWGAFSIG